MRFKDAKLIGNRDIEEMLQDVKQHSQLHFEKMDNDFLNEITNGGGTDKWRVLSQIVSKYPTNPGVAAALEKYKQEQQEEQRQLALKK